MNTPADAHIAVDFGGGSGRVMAGTIDSGGVLHIDEVHRFGNRQVWLGRHLYWDFPALYAEMAEGMRKAVAKGYRIRSVGIDTWGVDFGLIDRAGNLLGNPVCYRDPATAGYPDRLAAAVAPTEHYATAGIQVMEINTVYRLMAMTDEQPQFVDAADRLLFMPDLFSYFLTGNANVEYTIASTSELLDARGRIWNFPLIRRLGLPERLFGPIVMPGTVRGMLTADVARQIGVDYDVPVVAVGSHDTASAVFASAATKDPSTAYLSSGTWSLLGVLLDAPLLSEQARVAGFTNEGGVGGKIRFLQNITGLWILQRLMAQWSERGYGVDYDTVIDEASKACIDSVIDVDDRMFVNPADMESAVCEWCRLHGQQVPSGRGETVRVVIRSLADRYRRGIEALNKLLPSPVKRLNIIGGGSRNGLLNRMTAEAAGVEVTAGPAEATAIGNILLQAIAVKRVAAPDDIKSVEFR
jgi:rhamnulokinase